MSKLRDAMKTILENNLSFEDGFVSLYWANGPMGYREGDSTPYVVHTPYEESEVYEEYEDVDEAITSFLRHASIDEA